MRRLALLTALALLAGCGGDADPSSGGSEVVIEGGEAAVTVEVEIANSPDERARGLMGRASLAPDAGMIFLWDEPHRGSFWMKDTLVPLSIAFVDAGGRILRILDMEPCPAEPCPLYDPGVTYRSALEVNRGAFAGWGVSAGDLVRLEL